MEETEGDAGKPNHQHIAFTEERGEDGRSAEAAPKRRNVTKQFRLQEALAAREAEFRLLIENSPDLMIRHDRKCRILYFNPTAERLFGGTSAWVGKTPVQAVPEAEERMTRLERRLRRVVATGQSDEFEFSWPVPGGELRTSHVVLAPVRGADDRIEGVISVGRDVTERKRTDDAWRFLTQRGWGDDEDAFFPALVEYLGRTLGVAYVVAGRLAEDPGVAETIALYARGELQANIRYPLAGTPCQNVANVGLCCYREAVRELFPDDRLLVEMGVESYVGIPLQDVAGRTLGLVAVMDDKPLADAESAAHVLRLVAARASAELVRQRSERVLQAREREFRVLVEQSPDYIVRYDRQGRRLYINPALQRLTGAQLPVGETPAQGSPIIDADSYRNLVEGVLADGAPRQAEVRYRHPDGRTMWVDVRVCAESGDDGQVESVFAIGRDITDAVELREKIRAQALTDPLTRLSNRQALYERGPKLIDEARRRGCRLAVMILDVDRFKEVNDTMGHSVGDRLLCEVAGRIARCVRGYDLLARLGGDEFAVVAGDLDEDFDAALVATRICTALAQPFPVGDRPIFVTASVGLAMFPADGEDLEQLLSRADVAMYHAKRSGRNRFEFHRPEFTRAALQRIALEDALRAAQHGDGLELYFQPQVALDSQAVVGAEALLRWHHPELGLVTPDRFITIAEDTGLIVPIGRWVVQAACEAAVRWNRGRKQPLRIAVNVSTRQFIQDDLPTTVRDVLARTGCRAAWLEIEVTESLLLEDNEQVQRTMRALRSLGVSLSIDDFGTGYSALGYLTRFDVTCLKIDRGFINGIERDSRQRELVKAFVAMARALGMSLVAEGVESAWQAKFLLEQQCPLAQGYLFSPPLPADEFERRCLPPLPETTTEVEADG